MGNYSTIALPWTGTLQSFLQLKDDQDVIRSSVLWIVMTRLGERVMLPLFGTSVPDALHEPNDTTLEQNCEETVRDALREFEDRVEFDNIDFVRSGNTMTAIIKFVNSLDPLHQTVQELRISPTLVLAR